jgi:HK97 family phage major capsid protein
MNQRELARKADIAVQDLISNGGYLNPEQSNRFIQMVQDQPTVLKPARRVTMGGPKRYIEKIGFGSRILRKATASGVALEASKRAAPTTGKIELVTDELIAEVNIPYDVLEDNIEKDNLEDTIMAQMAARTAIDLEEYFLLADTSSADEYLALTEGVLKRVTTHTVGLSNAEVIDKAVFKSLVKTMPPKYFRNKAAFRFFSSHQNEIDYRDTLADRQGNMGDSLVEGDRRVAAYGVPVIPASMMPESKILLTNPQNLIWGIQRDIMIETDKDIRARVYIIVLTLRVAIQIEEEEACVLGTGLTVNS